MRKPFAHRVLCNLFVLLVICAFVVVSFQSGVLGSEYPPGQPIAFNHQKHIQNNVKCFTCHQYYADHAMAGIPGVAVCVTCHEDVVYLTPEKEKIQAYYRGGEEIPWKQVYFVPAHVYFSHKRHVTFGGIDCTECHGDATKWTRPLTEPEVRFDMDTCIECHRKMQDRTQLADVYNCNRCHR